jgi:hypothetical protein
MKYSNGIIQFNYNKFLFNLYIIVLIIYPYIFLINMLSPKLNIIGKNFYIVIMTLVVILIFLSSINRILSRKGTMIILGFGLTLPLMIILLRYLVYNENLSNILAASVHNLSLLPELWDIY